MLEIAALLGFDSRHLASLGEKERSYFLSISAFCLGVALVTGGGMIYGGYLATKTLWLALPIGVGAVVIVINFYRLLHAASGFPLHDDIARLDLWRPGLAGAAVLFVLGGVMMQPIVLAIVAPSLRAGGGLIAAGHATWSHPVAAGSLTVLCGLAMSATSWLRFFFRVSVRAYERLRWQQHRDIVDGAFADAETIITRSLEPMPSFDGSLRSHYADPPYNTRPLLFGFDPGLIERDGVRFIRPAKPIPDEREGEEPTSVPEEAVPSADVGPEQVAPPTPEEPAPAVVSPEPEAWDSLDQVAAEAASKSKEAEADDNIEEADDLFGDDDNDDDEEKPKPVALDYIDIGRMLAPRARRHVEQVVPFMMALTGRDEVMVRGLLRIADDDTPMHRLFSEWKSLRSILLHPAGFALDHKMSGVISIAVGVSEEEVRARLKAAPPDRRLSGVFARELARKLLGKDIG